MLKTAVRRRLDPVLAVVNSSCPALNRTLVNFAKDSSPFSFAVPLVGSLPLQAGKYCSFDFPITNPTRRQNAANVSVQLRFVLLKPSKKANFSNHNLFLF
jgi:hypothetical protein